MEMVDVLQAEENMRMAVLLRLFTAKAETKNAASELRRKQTSFMNRQKRIRDRVLRRDHKPKVEPIDPSTLNEQDRDRLRQWAAEQGIETQ